MNLQVLPDFGYQELNYLIDSNHGNKWRVISGLLGDKARFSWLMNYIQLSKLEVTLNK
jgi:hypothetical protein